MIMWFERKVGEVVAQSAEGEFPAVMIGEPDFVRPPQNFPIPEFAGKPLKVLKITQEQCLIRGHDHLSKCYYLEHNIVVIECSGQFHFAIIPTSS